MYPQQVDVDEKAIAKLTKTFEDAYKSIYDEIATATDFGVANRKAILAQIHAELTRLGVDVQKFVAEEIPAMYKSGANDAVTQLQNIGADVNVTEGFNRVHTEAIKMLVDDTAKAFAESMTGVDRSANLLLGKISRQAITQKLAEGIIGGKARAEINKIIKGTLQEQGLSALVDKGGHTWTLDRYADMLFRTKAVEARNRGLINRMVENDYDLVQVSDHNTSHEACAVWEGEILSATGATPGYPTVADAEAAGLFHPNCKHAINALIPSLASRTSAYDPDTGDYGPPGASILLGGKNATKQSAMPKLSTVVLNAASSKHTVAVTDVQEWEMQLAKERNLSFAGQGAPRNYGMYFDFKYADSVKHPYLEVNNASIAKTYAKDPELYVQRVARTFYHEMGHFIDYKYDTTPLRLTEAPEVLAKLKEEAKAILVKRMESRYLGTVPGGNEFVDKYNMTVAHIEKLITGAPVQLEAEGQTYKPILQLSRKDYRYYWSSKEVFADAYAQYRTQPAEFEKYAPKMFDYFKSLGGDTP